MPRWSWLVPMGAVALLVAALVYPLGTVLASGLCPRPRSARSSPRSTTPRSSRTASASRSARSSSRVAVTVIEVSLILSMMLAGGAGHRRRCRATRSSRPHDHLQRRGRPVPAAWAACATASRSFRVEGANAGARRADRAGHAVARAARLHHELARARRTPRRSSRSPPSRRSRCGRVFVFVQTVRHRDYFLPAADAANDERARAAAVDRARAGRASALLLVSLVRGRRARQDALADDRARPSPRPARRRRCIGIAIAMLVLLPETWAAVRAARANRLQTSLNLALGSALASIGLTIPVVAARVDLARRPARARARAARTSCCSSSPSSSARSRWRTGRTHMMQGAVHLVIFAAFLFLALVP